MEAFNLSVQPARTGVAWPSTEHPKPAHITEFGVQWQRSAGDGLQYLGVLVLTEDHPFR